MPAEANASRQPAFFKIHPSSSSHLSSYLSCLTPPPPPLPPPLPLTFHPPAGSFPLASCSTFPTLLFLPSLPPPCLYPAGQPASEQSEPAALLSQLRLMTAPLSKLTTLIISLWLKHRAWHSYVLRCKHTPLAALLSCTHTSVLLGKKKTKNA